MNIKDFLRPTKLKVLITLIMPVFVYIIVTFRVESILDFYFWLLTPTIKVYADVMYTEFNPFILLWIPFYLASCMIEAGYRRGTKKIS